MPDFENNRYDMLDNSDRAEAIRIKKLKQGVIANTDNEEYQKEKNLREQAPVSFLDKVKNFWYHYKSVVIIGSVLGVILVFLLLQGINKEVYDTTIMLHTNTYYSDGDLAIIADAFSDYIDDLDGDDKVNIGILQSKQVTDDSETVLGFEGAMQARMTAEIASGKNCIFIVEKDLVNGLTEKGVFADLRDILPIEASEAVYSVPLKDSKLLKNEAFKNVRDKYYLSVRVYKEGTDRDKYNGQVEALKRLYSDMTK
ncbi:MAG: hypothetical protein E7539_00375 [Ruminococcaceae bacterium]|nr:hypothetical protein [Oscillospiraceae bacterium]